MYAIKILFHQPYRYLLTTGGIGLCIVLILFLLGIYRGVADGSVEYIRQNRADLWIMQKNTTNILRGTSILSTAHGYVLRDLPGLENISPILLLLSTIKMEDNEATVFLTGYDLTAPYGGPPEIIQGQPVRNDDEIVLDISYAEKHDIEIGDKVHLNGYALNVCGFSTGTNAFVIQYAFVSLERAQSLIDFNNLVTCYCADFKADSKNLLSPDEISDEVPGTVVYTHEKFLKNNIREMESGILPLLYAIAAIGSVVLTVILTLILSINILEYRKDFAVMKALGSPKGYLPGLIINQSSFLVGSAILFGLFLFFPMVKLITKFSPEIETITSAGHIITIILAVGMMSLISSFFSIRKLRKIYPLEVYE